MGYQYARQLSQIFGTWILELIGCHLSDGQIKALKAYEWYIQKQAPEMIGFFKGMVEGARKAGVSLKYEQVLAQFCLGVQDGEYVDTPADLLGYPKEMESQSPASPKENAAKCGSIAAWGKATKDGKVITSGSSDGNDHFNVTIVCFPEDGNAYIHSPYYAVGPWVSAGGHSGMNDKGLVYVHHGVTRGRIDLRLFDSPATAGKRTSCMPRTLSCPASWARMTRSTSITEAGSRRAFLPAETSA
jgi:hypothetical protein